MVDMKLVAVGGPRLAEALRLRPLPADADALLSTPTRVTRFILPAKTAAGTTRLLTAWRLRYSDLFGPTKGGVRFHPATTEADLTALALRLLLKCAVNGLPHGGAAGGVAVDHSQLSAAEPEQVAPGYVDALGGEIGPDRDILSPDLGTDARTMGWMADQYNRLHRTSVAAAINGKPLSQGGIHGRPGATARGACHVLSEVLQSRGIDPTGLTCAVQGYGSAGGHLAVRLQAQGLRVIAASDSSGGWHDPRGLDAQALWQEKASGRRFADLEVAGASRLSREGVLTAAADIVIPAAIANQITAEVAAGMSCRIILEMANGPIAAEAEAAVAARGILVIPDVVANAGGITMSHFEWAQNRSGLPWTADDARTRLDARMIATARSMIHAAQEHNVSLAVAAQLLAVQHISARFS